NKGAYSESLINNLDYSVAQMGLIQAGGGSWYQNTVEVINSLPVEFWISLTLIFLSVAIWKLRFQLKAKAYFRLVVFSLLATTAQVYYWGFLNDQMYAIVLEELPVHEGPSAVFGVQKTLRAGEKIRVGKTAEGWSLIVAPAFYRGWVQNESLGFIRRL